MTLHDTQFDTAQRMGELLFRRLRETITDEERAELDGWLSHGSREYLTTVTEWEELEQALQVMYSVDMDAAFRDVQKKIETDEAELTAVQMQGSRSPARVLIWRRLAAAAVIVAVGVGVLYYTRIQGDKPAVVSTAGDQPAKKDITPGGDRAVLQQADGHRIVLDSVAIGVIFRQGSIKISKLAEGQLFYSAGVEGNSGSIAGTSYNTLTTPKGGQYQVILQDGSRIWLNAASSLRFPTSFTGSARHVSLTGEAYFQVSQKVSMPFRVEVPREDHTLQVDVLGTEFNLMAYSDEKNQETTVLSGAVKVRAGSRQLVLARGQQALVGTGPYDLKRVDNVNTEEVTAWKEGRFQFDGASVETIMRQAARWYNIEVVYEEKIDQQFNGNIPRQVNLSNFLRILEATGKVHFTVEGNKVSVRR